MRTCWMLVLAGVLSCSGGTEPPPPNGGDDGDGGQTPRAAAQLHVLDGADQVGTVGTELPEPVVVKVADVQGLAVGGQIINFVVVSGGGRVFAGSAQANASGEARERWTLGPTAGEQVLEARAVDQTTGAPIVFQRIVATAQPAGPAAITLRRPDTTATVGQPLDVAALVERVTDAYGNAIAAPALTVTAGAPFTVTGTTITAAGEVDGAVTVRAGAAAQAVQVTALRDLAELVGARGSWACSSSPGPRRTVDGYGSVTVTRDEATFVIDSITWSSGPGVPTLLHVTETRTTTFETAPAVTDTFTQSYPIGKRFVGGWHWFYEWWGDALEVAVAPLTYRGGQPCNELGHYSNPSITPIEIVR